MTDHEARLRYAERFGLHIADEHTMPNMTGRVMGSLLITREPERSIDSLAEELRASRGAISMAIKDLTRLGLVEKVSRAGDRKYYYHLRPNVWARMYLERLDNYEEHVRIAEEGLRLLDGEPPERRERLLEMGAFFQFLLEKLPEAAAEWRERGPELMKSLERKIDAA
jgi:DNA-binding transcriptional regulator GbsR (MarR family)